jgi:hypothetical protein
LALAAVAGHCVTIVNMRVLADVESDFQARVHPDFEVALRVDVFDSAEITISNLQFVSWRGELNPLLAWRRSGALSAAAPSPKN